MITKLKLPNRLKYIILLSASLNLTSCSVEDESGCEIETVCFGNGNCIEKPIEGTCFN